MSMFATWAVIMAFGYFVFAFMGATFNPLAWHMGIRILYGLYIILFTAGTIQYAANELTKQEQRQNQEPK